MANTVTFQTQKENGEWKTWENVVLPVKYGTLLDEQLDYSVVTLSRVKKKVFKPMTRAKLIITSETKFTQEPQTKTIDYFIANDDGFETPIGSKAYNHELTLIELTKFLECFPLESLCFTNPNGNKYVGETTLPPTIIDTNITGVESESFYKLIDTDSSDITTPATAGTTFDLYNIKAPTIASDWAAIVTIRQNGNIVRSYHSKDFDNGIAFKNASFSIVEGINEIEYKYVYYDNGEIPYGSQTFIIYGVKNKYPLKPWTVEDVIQRVLDLVEPIRLNEEKRFKFVMPTDNKAKLFTQFAPEFTFTRMTLREALQAVGGFIHAEPRLTKDNEIVFDYYGEQEYVTVHNYRTGADKRLSETKYRALQSVYGIEQACTKLDSYQQNLVNRLDWEQATTAQPYKGGAQTLRTESAYIRGQEEASFYFPTIQGIDRIVKFEYIDGEGSEYDITPYIFEEKIYNNLSSYGGEYPKDGALYYTQGERGVKGLFFKRPSAWASGAFNNYAIINILAAIGAKLPTKNEQTYNYDDMKFRLSYVPVYSTRVQQSKPYLTDYLPLPRVLNYNQTDNSVETRFFGENIKGAVSRMGNPEKTYTINLRNLNNIPKAGQLWDDEYYIASVSVSVNLDMFEVSVGLSKNFNRKSQYIGASSIKRIYEVSEEMVQQRHTIYTDYMVITKDTEHPNPDTCYLTETGVKTLSSIFINSSLDGYWGTAPSISFVVERGYTKSGSPQESVLLPVVSSAFGNVMEFTWEYKDNFSAGIQSVKPLGGGDVIQGSFGKEVEYTDYYGRLWSSEFHLLSKNNLNEEKIDVDLLPRISADAYMTDNQVVAANSDNRVLERKDSREALKKSYAIEFVTDETSFIIGSALASKNPLVYSGNRKTPKLYILKNRVNKLDTHINVDDIVADFNPNYPDVLEGETAVANGFTISSQKATVDGVAWAYAIPEYDGDSYTVETEDGEAETITPKFGGEILLAENIEIKKDQYIGGFSMMLCHDIFKYIEEKNKK